MIVRASEVSTQTPDAPRILLSHHSQTYMLSSSERDQDYNICLSKFHINAGQSKDH